MLKFITKTYFLPFKSIVVVGFLLFNIAAFGEPSRIPYPLPVQKQLTWQQVFDNPRLIELTTYQTGLFRVDPRKLLDADDEQVADFVPSQPNGLPVYAHLLQHREQGVFLIDTGFSSAPHEHAGEQLNGFIRRTNKAFEVAEGEGLAEQLGGFIPKIRTAFITHLHFDHIGGAIDLQPQTSIVVGRSTPSPQTRVAMGNFLAEIETLYEIDYSQGRIMEPMGRSVDLLGDGSLWALETPGHTGGHMSFLVNALQGPILLTGDVSHFGWGFERDIPSVSNGGDSNLQRESLRQLRQLKKSFPEIQLIFGHELSAKLTYRADKE